MLRAVSLYSAAEQSAAADLLSGQKELTDLKRIGTVDLLAALPSLTVSTARKVADFAAVDAALSGRAADLLTVNSAAAVVSKAVSAVDAESRAAVARHQWEKLANGIKGKRPQAIQTARRQSTIAAALEAAFNPPLSADLSAADLREIVPTGTLLKFFASWCTVDADDATAAVSVPTYGSDGRKIRGMNRPLSAADVSAVRSAARSAVGARGGLNESAFRESLAAAGLLPAKAVKAAAAPLTDNQLDALLVNGSGQQTANPQTADALAARLSDLMESGQITAGESLAAVERILSAYRAAFAPAADQTAADDAAADLLTADYADDAAAAAE